MSDELEKYLAAAISFGDKQTSRDFVAGNKYASRLEKLGKEIMASSEGRQYLLSLLTHDNPYVRTWAAKDALVFCPDRAVPVLEELGAIQGLIGLSARTVLSQWKGRQSIAR